MADRKRILEVKNLKTHFHTREGTLRAVEGVSFDLVESGVLGVVGESGCGKSITASSILQILPSNGSIVGGEIRWRDEDGRWIDIHQLSPRGKQMKAIRGQDIAMVFQEPMTAFSMVYTIGNQIMENLLTHKVCDKKEARDRAIEILRRVGMPKPEQRVDAYPFELSGGMRQRAMIAMALVGKPRLLIADEPTTALDVTIEAQILSLMQRLQSEMGMAIMIITHDLSVVAEMTENVLVMYLGEDVEYGTTKQIYFEPKHPYTRELLASVPKLGQKTGDRLPTIKGTVPSLYERPKGCPFHTRCREFMKGLCDEKHPPMVDLGDGHRTRCFLYGGRDAPEGTAMVKAETVNA